MENAERKMLNFKNYTELEEGFNGVAVEDMTDEQWDKMLNEILNIQQRVKLKQALRRNKARIKLGAARARKRIASLDVLRKRSVRQAKNVFIKKFLKNKSKADLSYAGRVALEKRLKGKTSAIQRLAKKLLPSVRQKDRAKLRKPSGGQNAKS